MLHEGVKLLDLLFSGTCVISNFSWDHDTKGTYTRHRFICKEANKQLLWRGS